MIDADHLPDVVVSHVRQALLDAFSFDAREFAQSVYLSEVIEVMQHVDGVIAVDVDDLSRTDASPGGPPPPRLSAAPPDPAANLGAELLTIDPLTLNGITARS